MANNKEVKVRFKYENDQNSLNQIKKQIDSILNMTEKDINLINTDSDLKDLEKIKKEVKKVQDLLNSSKNEKLGVYDFSKFQAGARELMKNSTGLKKAFNAFGIAGKQAYAGIYTEASKSNVQLKQQHTTLENIAKTFANSAKYTAATRTIDAFTSSIEKAWSFTKQLDSSLNDIRIVTGKGAEEMERYAIAANKAAKQLGAGTKDYTNASLIYYQQGLNEADVQARTQATLKAANVTGQSARQVSEQLTAVWNGYKVSASETEMYVDKLAATAASTAADLEELSTGMSKVAAAANTAGVDFDQLNAILSTVVSVTREAPETIGSSFKTLFARLGDLTIDGEDEFGVSLGKVSGQLEQLGVSILDEKGEMRDMGSVIEEVAGKWQTWTRAQKQAAAIAMGGKMQYARLMTLFENWDMYENALSTSRNSLGALQEQQDIYMDRTSAHLQQLSTSWEKIFNSFIDNKGVNSLIDGLTTISDLLGNITSGIGGLGTLSTIGAVLGNSLTKTAQTSLTKTFLNKELEKKQKREFEEQQKIAKDNASKAEKGSMEADIENTRVRMYEYLSNTQGFKTQEEQKEIQDRVNAWEDERRALEDINIELAEMDKTFEENNKKSKSDIEKYNNMSNGLDEVAKSLEYFANVDIRTDSLDEYLTKLQRLKEIIEEFEKNGWGDPTGGLLANGRGSTGKVAILKGSITKTKNKLGKIKKDIDIEKYTSEFDTIEKEKAKKERELATELNPDKRASLQKELAKINKEYNEKRDTLNAAFRILENTSIQTGEMHGNIFDIRDTQEKAEDIKKQSKEYKNKIKDEKKEQEEAKKNREKKQREKEEADNRQKNLKGKLFGENNDDEELAHNRAKALTDLGTVVMDLTSIVSVCAGMWRTFADEEASAGEKAISLMSGLSALAFTIPSLLSSGKELLSLISKIKLGALVLNPVFLGVTAAIAIAGVAIYKFTKESNRQANEYKNTQKQVETLSKSYEECAAAAEKLYNSINDYNNGVKALSELQRGTEEYREALEKTNEQAKLLIENYKLLTTDYEIDENGLIKINNDALISKQIEARNKEAIAENNEKLGERRNIEQSIGKEIESYRKNFNKNLLINGSNNKGLDWSERNRYQTVTDKELNDLITLIINKGLDVTSMSEKAIIDFIRDDTNKLSKNIKLLAGDFAEGKDELNKYTSAIKEAKENIQKIDNEKLRQAFLGDENFNKRINQISSDKDGELNEGKQELVLQALEATSMGKAISDEVNYLGTMANLESRKIDSDKKFKEIMANNNINGYENFNIKDLINNYLTDTLQYDKNDLKRVKVSKNGAATWSEDYTDSKGAHHTVGDEIVDKSEVNTIRQTYAESILSTKSLNDYKKYIPEMMEPDLSAIESMLISVEPLAQEYGVDFGNIILNAMKNTVDYKIGALDFSSAFEKLSEEQINNLKGLSVEELKEKLGFSDEVFRQIGYDNVEAFKAAFDEGLNEYRRKIENELTNTIQSFGSNVSKDTTVNLSNLSTKQMSALNDRPLAVSQIDFSQNQEDVSKQLDYLANSAIKATKKMMQLTDAQKEEAKELGYDEEALKAYAKQLEHSNEGLKDNEEGAVNVALANIRMNKGIETLSSNFEKWNDVLKDNNQNSPEYWEAMSKMKDALEDMFGVEVSDGFIQNEENLKKLGEIAEGNIESFDELQKAATRDYVANMDIVAPSEEKMDEIRNSLLNMVDDINSRSNIDIGVDLDQSYVDQLNEMLRKGQITEEQMNSTLSGIGYTPVVTTKKVERTTETRHELKANLFGQSMKIADITDVQHAWVDVPQIESANYTGPKRSANINRSNTAGGKKSGGGGKGGGDSKPDSKDPIETAKDRYHDINIILKNIETEFNRLEKAQEKFLGTDLINNLNKQWELLNRQIAATNEKIRIANGELSELREKLNNKGITFNQDGTIANYSSAYDAQLNYVNDIIAQYNSMSKESQESFSATVEQAQKDFENFVSNIERYDTIISEEIPGMQDEIQDAIDKQIEINISKFNMEIEIRLNMAEAERDWNAFKKKVIDEIKDDDILGNAKAQLKDFFSYYKENEKGIIQANTRHVLDTLEQLRQIDATGTSSVYGNNEAQALEDLKKYNDQLMSDLSDIKDLTDEIKSSYLKMMDEASDKFKDQEQMYEQMADVIKHDMNVIELVYGKQNRKTLNEYFSQMEKNINNQLVFQKREVDFWKQQMEEISDKNSEEWLKAKENWLDAVNSWNSTVENAIENLQDKYLNTIDGIFEDLNKKVSNGLGLDYVSEEWELINKNADQYLDTVNSIFEIQQLEKKYLDAIDNTDSLSAQRKLRDIMEEEMRSLRDKDKLTRYDVERAEKKYQIRLKEIALEEAQQNKTMMRLKRDSQGNYSYQYVANEDEIKRLRDEIDGAYNDLYNFDLNRYKENLDGIYSTWDEMQNKMHEVYADTTLSEEERHQKLAMLQEQYNELINGMIAENNVVRVNLQESMFDDLTHLYDDDLTAYEAMNEQQRIIVEGFTDDVISTYNNMDAETQSIIAGMVGMTRDEFNKLSEDERMVYLSLLANIDNSANEISDKLANQIVPYWDSSVQHMADEVTKEGGFLNVSKDAFDELEQAVSHYKGSLTTMFNAAQVDINNLKDGYDKIINTMRDMTAQNDVVIDKYKQELDAVRSVINELNRLEGSYNNAANAAKRAAEEAYNYWNAINNKAADEVQDFNSNPNNTVQPVEMPSAPSDVQQTNGGSSNQGGGPGAEDLSIGNAITFSGSYYLDSYGTSPTGRRYAGITDGVVIDRVNNNPYGIHIKSADGRYPDLGWIKKSQVTQWNTGGYTGDWGNDSGKLAILHRKEIILNKEDTENMLKMLELTRDMIGRINLPTIMNSITGLSNTNGGKVTGLEQQVHITAEFPNVEKASEVENALKNLVNIASQRANIK